MVRAAIDGRLNDSAMRLDPIFGFEVPISCPGVPSELLDPRATWRYGSEYDAQARRLADAFAENSRAFAGETTPEVQAAAPQP